MITFYFKLEDEKYTGKIISLMN